MLKEFEIAAKQGEHTHDVDVSLFSTFEQLTDHLAKVFKFADAEGKYGYGSNANVKSIFFLKERLTQDSVIPYRRTEQLTLNDQRGSRNQWQDRVASNAP